jgi:hypothetical protein
VSIRYLLFKSEIFDRAVRAMNETLKQNRLQRDHVNDGSCSYIGEDKSNANDGPNDVHACFIVYILYVGFSYLLHLIVI